MNESTPLNSELLSADARGRKHIPVAVFAVILIHVVLFLVLLIAAGCRSSARAKRNGTPAQEVQAAETQPIAPAPETVSAIGAEQSAVLTATQSQAQPIAESVIATEPSVEQQPQPVREAAQQAPAVRKASLRSTASHPTAKSTAGRQQFYVVRAGDTLGKIARQHGVTIEAMRTANKMKGDLIFPGQKLQLSPVNAAQARKKRSNEV